MNFVCMPSRRVLEGGEEPLYKRWPERGHMLSQGKERHVVESGKMQPMPRALSAGAGRPAAEPRGRGRGPGLRGGGVSLRQSPARRAARGPRPSHQLPDR